MTYQTQNGVVDLPAGGITAVGTGLVNTGGTLSVSPPSILINSGSVAISSAQLLALSGTVQTIIPAPGNGLMTVVNQAIYELEPGTTAYTASSTNGLVYAGTGALADVPPANAFWQGTTKSARITVGPTGVIPTGSGANQAIALTGNLTTGNGSLNLTVHYSTVQVQD